MKILIISKHLPTPDRASGDLRLFSIIKTLAKHYDLTLAVYSSNHQKKELGTNAFNAYYKDLTSLGVSIVSKCTDTIRNDNYACVVFEFYHSAMLYLDLVRFNQPHSTIIIDSVDVHFNRLLAKARLTGSKQDFQHAKEVKKEEIKTYRQADIVIAVTNKDKNLLFTLCNNTKIVTIPNIHIIPELNIKNLNKTLNLLFVGGFNHDPNIDAISFFCSDVMPALRNQVNNLNLTVVGSSPTEEVLDLATSDIKITGFVPSLKPYYEKSDIVIAPLRFGGGMKGKVGEAFSYSRPVITTAYGAEGFNIKPGIHFILANTADEFVQSILKLHKDLDLYKKITANAWKYIHDNYSDKKVSITILNIFNHLDDIHIKKLNIFKYIKFFIVRNFNQYIFWRFK